MVALRDFDTETDPVPPGHGESDPRSDSRGSHVYTDSEWGQLVPLVRQTSRQSEEEIDFA
jgi:hypothetical protein